MREPALVLDEQLRIVAANPAFLAFFNQEFSEVANRSLFDRLPLAGDPGDLRDQLDRLLQENGQSPPIDLIVDFNVNEQGLQSLRLRLSRVEVPGGSDGRRIVVLIDDPHAHDTSAARQARVAAVFRKASGSSLKPGGLADALEIYVPLICELTDWPVGHFWLKDEDQADQIRGNFGWHVSRPNLPGRTEFFQAVQEEMSKYHFKRGEGLPGKIWEHGEPAWITDMMENQNVVRKTQATRAGIRGAFGFPVKIRGETVAVFEFFSDRPMALDRTMLVMLRGLGEQIGGAIEFARMETSLRRVEFEFGDLVEQAPIGILILSPQGVIQRANRRLLEQLGYATHDFVGQTLQDFLIEQGQSEVVSQSLAAAGTRNEVELRLRARDGSARHIRMNVTVPAAPDGKPVTQVRCFVHDITDQARHESELARLAAIVQSSDDAIIGLSPDGMVTSWNRGAERLYGHSAEEVVGGSISLIIPPEREEEMTRLLETVTRGERVEQFETVRVHRDGRRIHISMTASPIQSEASEHTLGKAPVIGMAMIERDISERKRVAAEIRRAVQEAERANRAKGEFLANVSHELRTPMNAIIGMTELSLDEPLSERVRDYLETANDNAATLLRLLNDILDFSRMEAGRFEIDEADFSLREILDETIKSLAIRAHEKGLEIALRIPADVPDRLVGDPVRLRQVLTNLAGNAIKFTESGEVVIEFQVQSIHGDEVFLHGSVRDTGIGISVEDQEKIFAPFAQVDATSTRNHGGAGLGLAICRELVAMMQGRMWIESQPNVGTCFHFTARFGVEPSTEGDVPSKVHEDLQGVQVLVIDDNETNRKIIAESLTRWKMKPILADSAEAGLREIDRAVHETRPIPLVIVDGLMPDMNGFAFIKHARERGKFQGAVLLMLSNSERRLFAAQCQDLDIAGYLEKPVTQSELLDSVQASLNSRPESPSSPQESHTIGGAVQPFSFLLVEDTPANRKVVTAVLHKRGHAVTIAVDGREAVETFKRRRDFDAILMDVQMPNMDGYQATSIIRTIEENKTHHTPIIAMTAHAMQGDRERCLAAGMDAYLSKPIDVRRMIRLVERVAARSRRASGRDRAPSIAHGGHTNRLPNAGSSEGATQSSADESDRPGIAETRKKYTYRENAMSPSASGSGPLFDKPSALERLGGDEQLFQELITYFCEDAETLLDNIQSSAKKEDWPSVRVAAHSLKGLAANFSAFPATEASRQLEDAAAVGDSARIRALIQPATTEIEKLRVALTAEAQGK